MYSSAFHRSYLSKNKNVRETGDEGTAWPSGELGKWRIKKIT